MRLKVIIEDPNAVRWGFQLSARLESNVQASAGALAPTNSQTQVLKAGTLEWITHTASGTRNGYTFIYAAVDTDGNGQFDQYTVNANPVQVGTSGEKYFYVDHTNVIRENLGGPADANSSPIPKQ